MQLLQDRKKEPCQKGWLQELPHKALKLEKQLYKAAPSLQSYMDESTLKHRLRKIANAITTHIRLKKANAMQRRLASSLPPNSNAPNAERRRSSRVEVDAPRLSQIITTNIADSNSGTNNVDQTQILGQMLDMQRTLNNLMKISSMNGTDVSSEQHQLQQQMLDMQNQLNQMNRQSLSSVTFPAINGSLSSNPLPTSQNNSNNNFTSNFNSTNPSRNYSFNANSLRSASFNASPSRNVSFNANSSSTSIDFNTNSIPSALNNIGSMSTTFNTTTDETASNDGDLDIDFLQETFGSNNNVAV